MTDKKFHDLNNYKKEIGTMSNWNREHKVVQYHLLNGKDKNNG